MTCDYCDEGLPLWHRREDPEGFEPTQIIPCQTEFDEDHLLTILSHMIDAGFSRDDVAFVADLAKGRL